MSRVLLLRHAKAAWAAPGMRDFDRPLDATGRADALEAGKLLTASGLAADITLCSTARRTRETLDAVATHASVGEVRFVDALYNADATGYLDAIRAAGEVGSLMLVGHNPMMEDLAAAVAGEAEPEAMALLRAGFPTSGLAVVSVAGPLSDLRPGRGRLDAFLTPARRR